MLIANLRASSARGLRKPFEDTALRGPIAAALVAALGLACRTGVSELPPEEIAQRTAALVAALERTSEKPPAGAVRVRLAFGDGSDLDLYVTDADPRSNETVYFARHASRSGGRWLRDARCGDAAPRTDAVVFDRIPAGGLRIGVDHHAGCGDHPKPEPFAVEIETVERREVRTGVARPGHFADDFWRWTPEAQRPG